MQAATPSCRRPRAQPGMTLIELLVVIAIISLLAAVIMPAVSGMQERGRKTFCANNLRQIGLGVKSYMMDHDNIFYAATNAGAYGEVADNYRQELDGSYDVFRCPSQRQDLPAVNASFETLLFPSDETRWTRYEFNGYLSGAAFTRKMVPSPGRCAYVYDAVFWDEAYRAHDDGVNVLFMDWHVTWLASADFTNEAGLVFTEWGHVFAGGP